MLSKLPIPDQMCTEYVSHQSRGVIKKSYRTGTVASIMPITLEAASGCQPIVYRYLCVSWEDVPRRRSIASKSDFWTSRVYEDFVAANSGYIENVIFQILELSLQHFYTLFNLVFHLAALLVGKLRNKNWNGKLRNKNWNCVALQMYLFSK